MTEATKDYEFRAIRVIVISSVFPANTSAGNVVLYRHLVNRKEIDLEISENHQSRWSGSSWLRRIANAIRGLSPRITQSLMLSSDGSWYTPTVYAPSEQPTVVLTVAHGDLFLVAMRYAREHDLPLVTFFHDWWPDLANVTSLSKVKVEAQFRALYENSTLALCVSEGMKARLGQHSNSHVLLPIPSVTNTLRHLSKGFGDPMRVAYAGNLAEYGPMLQSLMEAVILHPKIKLEVRGANPSWSAHFQQDMRQRGMLLPFVTVRELEAWMGSVDAFLILQSFEPAHARMMETNFPSKLLEMSKWGKPLLLWGPESASMLQWNLNGSCSGVGINDPNPYAVIHALVRIQQNTNLFESLCCGAENLSQYEFDSARIQAKFLKLLNGCCH